MTRRSLIPLVALATVLGPLGQASGRTRVALIPLAHTGKNASRVAWRATASMAKKLRRSRGVKVVVLGQHRAARLHQCLQVRDCIQAVTRKLNVRLLVAGHVTRVSNRMFHVDMRVVRADGEVVSSESFRTSTGKGNASGYIAVKLVRKASRVRLATAPAKTATDALSSGEPLFSPSEAAMVANLAGEASDQENPLTPPSEKKPAVKKAASLDGGKSPAAAPAATVNKEPAISTNIFSRRYTHAWATLGAGVAALGAGVAFGVVSKNSNQAAQDAEYQKESLLNYDKAKKNALVANVLYGVGGAAVLGSALMFYLEHRKEVREKRKERDLSIQLQVAHSGGGLTVSGSF